MGSSVREPGKEHIPRYPPGWITIRILQLIVACVCLGLNAYFLFAAFDFIWTIVCAVISLLTSVCTIIISIWLICAHSCAPRAFNYWACLILDIYLYCLWLVSFVASILHAAVIFPHYRSGTSDFDIDDFFMLFKRRRGGGGSYSGSSYHGDDDITRGYIAAAAAGLGGLQFLLFFICLVADSIVIYRHRKVGLHSRPSKNYGGFVTMQPAGVPSAYQAVPQQGIPYQQQDTAYNPHGMYKPQPAYQPHQQTAHPYPVAMSVSPAPHSSTPTPQPYSPQPQHPVTQTQPSTDGY